MEGGPCKGGSEREVDGVSCQLACNMKEGQEGKGSHSLSLMLRTTLSGERDGQSISRQSLSISKQSLSISRQSLSISRQSLSISRAESQSHP